MSKFSRADLIRWTAWFALSLLFAISCVFLSRWQFDRRAQVVAQIEIVNRNYDAPPISLDGLAIDELSDSVLKYRPVKLSGHYLPTKFLLVRNRANSGTPGFELLVPFVSKSNWIIDLGWIPTGSNQDYPDHVPLPSTAGTTITARLYPSEPSSGRSAPNREVQEINLPGISRRLQLSVNRTWYLQLVHSGNPEKLPAAVDKPSTDEGSHLSYAFQWIAFGALAIWFFFYALRKERQIAAGKRIARTSKPTRATLDNEAEDSLSD